MRFWVSVMSLLSVLGSVFLVGCEAFLTHHPSSITVGMSVAEVRARLGEPDAIYPPFAMGDEMWEYSQQPMGKTCYMLTLQNGVVSHVEQVLTPARFASVSVGLSVDEVLRLLGKPASQVRFERSGEDVYEWHFEGDNPLQDVYFLVHFDSSRQTVKRTSQRMVMRG